MFARSLLLVHVPALHLLVPAGPCHVSAYVITLIGKIMCYAIVALAMDLIWGYTGILSLGHGLFFALGGYAFGMYLMRQIGRDGSVQERPAGLHGVPRLEGTALVLDRLRFLPVGLALLVLLVPALVAFVFGYFAFRSRIKGVYFLDHHPGADLRRDAALLPQRNRLRRQQRLHRLQAHPRLQHHRAGNARHLFALTALADAGDLLLGRYLVTSKLGRVLTAIRDAESRVMFIGYNPLHYKLFIWTCRRCCAASPARCTCRRSASSTRARCRRPTRSRSRSGSRSADAAR
jgi:urea transport system permease protein